MNKAPIWIESLLDESQSEIEALLGVELENMLGCGHYGCVYSTNDPLLVVKITRDPAEGPLVSMIKGFQEESPEQMTGFVRFLKVLTWRDSVQYCGVSWPISIILREDVRPFAVGQAVRLDTKSRRLLDALRTFKERAAQLPYANTLGQKKLERELETTLDAMDKTIDGEDISNSLRYISEVTGIYLADIHAGNIGYVNQASDYNPGVLAIYDPGHTVIDDAENSKAQVLDDVPFTLSTIANEIATQMKQLYLKEIEEGDVDEDESFRDWLANTDQLYEHVTDAVACSFPLPWEVMPDYPSTIEHVDIMNQYIELISDIWEMYPNDEIYIDISYLVEGKDRLKIIEPMIQVFGIIDEQAKQAEYDIEDYDLWENYEPEYPFEIEENLMGDLNNIEQLDYLKTILHHYRELIDSGLDLYELEDYLIPDTAPLKSLGAIAYDTYHQALSFVTEQALEDLAG